MRVPAQEIQFTPAETESILFDIGELLAAGKLSAGFHVAQFEEEFAQYVGVANAVAVASGTMALELILSACGVRGRSVVVPANANFSTYLAAWRSGARVILCDIDPETLSPRLPDVEKVAEPDTAAVVLVHIGGFITNELEHIAQWCGHHNAFLIEDAAHAHASTRDGRFAGTFGLAGAYSFFATKVLACGEGGMVVSDDSDLASEVRILRNVGKPDAWTNSHTHLGCNGRMTELAAVVARSQLRRLDENVAARRAVAARYARLLRDVTGVRLLAPGHPYSGYKVVAMLAPHLSRELVKRRMADLGVDLAGEVYSAPLHQQPALAQVYGRLTFPGAELSCARQICLPIYPTLDPNRIEHVVGSLRHVVDE